MAAPAKLAREAVLDAACELFAREGAGAFSLRRVAAALDVTPMALYRYVANKEELLAWVLQRGFEEFEAYLARSAEGETGLDRLRLATEGFFDFALERGAYFELMFLGGTLPGEPARRASVRAVAEPTFVLLRDCVRSAVDASEVPPLDAHATAVWLLAEATGMVALHRSGLFGWTRDELRQRAESGLAAVLAGATGRGAR
ncbi:MAG: TetR/AcrR family transcriptional regulator [Myxococcota bacterium]